MSFEMAQAQYDAMEPPEHTPVKPCWDCECEVDLPDGIVILITSRGVDYLLCEDCLRDRL
jgi:hypothetical protein